jgi:site-specific recombinase XerD
MKNSFLYFLSKYLNTYLPLTVGASNNTIKAYSDTFKLLFLFAKEKYNLNPKKIQFETIDKKFILEFSNWILKTRKSSQTTINLRLTNIKGFFSYIQTEIPSLVLHSQTIMQIPKKKTERKVVEYISTDGIKLILDQPDNNSLLEKKHLIMLSFMYATGARVQEVIDVTINDFRYNNSNNIKLKGKGNKARLVPLENGMIKMLEKYIEHEKNSRVFFNPDDLLFLNKSGMQFTRQGIGYIVKKYSAMARNINSKLIPINVHPHTFRHSRAMALLEAGIELIYIRDFLGHYSVTTTEIYARVSNESTRQALLKISPSENITEIPAWQKDQNLLEFLKSLSEE